MSTELATIDLTLPSGFKVQEAGDVYRVIAQGAWTVEAVGDLDRALARVVYPDKKRIRRAEFNLVSVSRLDTAGAWLVHRTVAGWRSQGLETRVTGLNEDFEILIAKVEEESTHSRPAEDRQGSFARLLGDMGRALRGIGDDLVELTSFLGAFTVALTRVMAQPWRFRWVSFVHHMEQTGFRALPIISLICLLIGAVLAQQGAVQLRTFGAEAFAVNLVGILALREVGVLLTAVMVAGRSGSAFTAEIGSMKMREEIDALRTLAIDPMETLVVPRVAALIVVLPLLTFVGDIMCLVGGGIMAQIYLGLTPEAYVQQLHDSLTVRQFAAGMIKAPFAAIIIGLIGCLEGLRVQGSAESLGRHVTSAVVKAIFLVIIMDAVFAMFLSAIGI